MYSSIHSSNVFIVSLRIKHLFNSLFLHFIFSLINSIRHKTAKQPNTIANKSSVLDDERMMIMNTLVHNTISSRMTHNQSNSFSFISFISFSFQEIMYGNYNNRNYDSTYQIQKHHLVVKVHSSHPCCTIFGFNLFSLNPLP